MAHDRLSSRGWDGPTSTESLSYIEEMSNGESVSAIVPDITFIGIRRGVAQRRFYPIAWPAICRSEPGAA